MKTVYTEPNPSGAYPPIQEANFETCPEGMAEWPEELETETFYRYNGFVTLTVEDGRVKDCQPNVEAWEAWKASLPPEPGPSPTEITLEDVAEMLVDQEVRIAQLEIMGGGDIA